MIRICHLQLFPLLSGVQRSMLALLSCLDRGRYEIHVACKGPGPLADELRKLNVTTHYVPALDRPLRPGRDVQAYRQLRSLFAQHAFHMVHTHSSKTGFLGRLAARRAGTPVVVHHVHGFAYHDYSPKLARAFYGSLERFAARHCDAMVFVNRQERDQVAGLGWLPGERCVTVYNGVDLAALHPRLRQRPADAHAAEFVIAFVGRLDFQKQPLIIPQIAGQLSRMATKRRWRIVVIGSGPEEVRLQQAVRRAALEDRVTLLGWQSDVPAMLRSADAVLLPSLFEGLPMALVEAQALGLPTVASHVKGNREVVSPGTGYLCAARDPRAYAQALAQLVDDPRLCRSLGENARRHAETHFDALENNQRIVALYETLLAERGLHPRRISARPLQRVAA